MNWFKHYANADKDSRLQRLKTDYGFWGMGVYWSILERVVCYGEGCYPRNELMGMKLNRRDTGVIKAVLDRYDLFLTDEFGMVRCIKSVQQSGTFVPENDRNVHECGTEVPTLCTDSNAEEKQETAENKEDSPNSLAHTHVEEKREEKKREEENTLLNPPCEEVDDSVDKGRVDELTVPCHPEQSEGSVNACNRDDTGGRNQILHSVNSVQDDKASDNNTIPRNSVPSVSSVVCSSIIHELRTNRSWQEAVCITSGYGALLMRHFDTAIDIFLRHVRAGADEVELTDRRRAMNYFRNFTRLSHPAGRRLKEELERLSLTLPKREGTENASSLGLPPSGELRGASLLIIHCSATLPDQRVTVQDIDRWHRLRGFDCIGYHFYITVDGTIWTGRPLNQVGAHCKGYNAHSIGICYEGGLDEKGRPKDTRTLLQKAALVALINKLRELYPAVDVVGHNDLNLHKACPCFSAVEEYSEGVS